MQDSNLTLMDKLVKISNQLLDLGKRNRLLNYKDTGFKTLNILNTNIEQIFRGITNGKDFKIFNTDDALTEYRRSIGVTLEQENTMLYPNERILELFNKSLDVTDLLCFKQGSSLEKVLKSLVKEFRFSLIEKGINALYLSFCFIHYKEEDVEYQAPLLLVPVELDNETGSYILSEYEDEVLLNPTLAYYFDVMYNTKFVEYKHEALATYIGKILEILPEGVTLEQKCSIGIYSFYKMNMYNDLILHKDIVIQNKNIRYLLDGEQHIEESKDNNPIYPVVNFDSSQLQAIQFAANGISFCLQGPPGSGKSQTITNIIASLLGENKKILFVSEKIAALKVVYENLRRSGLSDFALELHSNKTNKKEFIDRIYDAAILPKYNMDFKTRAVVAKYDGLISNLSKYEYELHAINSVLGISLRDLYSEYLKIEFEPYDIEIDIEDLNLMDMDSIYNSLKKYEYNSKRLGYDYRLSFFSGLNVSNEEYLNKEFDKDLDFALHYTKILSSLGDILVNILSIDVKSIDDIHANLEILNRIMHTKTYKTIYYKATSRNKLYLMLEDYLKTNERLDRKILEKYDKSILDIDIEYLYATYKLNINSKKLFNKEIKECNNTIFKYRVDKKAKNEEIFNEIKTLLVLKNSLDDLNKYKPVINKYLGENSIEVYKIMLQDMKYLAPLGDLSLSLEGYKELKNIITSLNFTFKGVVAERPSFDKIAKLFLSVEYSLSKAPYKEVYNKLDGLYMEKSKIYAYIDTMKHISNLRVSNALTYLHTFLDNKYPIDDLGICYKKLFLRKNLKKMIKSSDILSKFNSNTEDEIVENFIDLDEKILLVNRDTIISNNSQKRPDKNIIIEGTEFKLLSREHEKNRRQMPIRQLLDQIFHLALDVKPVFLMSPLSVSTYLTSQLEMFDCVIFDEASQIFASDALGSIYRGKQCIIIGDTKQMPPTSFFQAEFGFEEDGDEYDMESILDKATTCYRTLSLKWHYRSRSEELINFSNQKFYNSNLITIPQAKTHEPGFGIDFEFVEKGLYDTQTRTNPIEAQYVCDLVFKHVKESNFSVGVVAFSNVQAELISDLVEKRLRKEPSYQKYFDKYDDEPFFVKNLESVQGDERDRIIFSICYGYNKEGKFHQRFGPLNTSGGERRLNVAITRAKVNITVVSSIHGSDINTKTTNSLGVVLLKNYLEFSQNVTFEKNYDDTDNGLINSIKEYVESLGYEAYTDYGSSAFKIDIAVKHGEDFILAIMIDGKSYSDSLSDKYRLERLLLERLGWTYYKLFSTSWMTNNNEEKAKLKEALDNIFSGNKEEVKRNNSNKNKSYLKIDKDEEDIESYFVEYQELKSDLALKYLSSYGLERLIKELVHIEAPISKNQLFKRLLLILEEKKLTAELKEKIENSIPLEIININDFLFENQYMNVRLRYKSNLPANEIYIDEYKDGIYTIAKKNKGISVDDCYRAIANLIGYEKLTANLRKQMDLALEDLKSNHKIRLEGNYLYIE